MEELPGYCLSSKSRNYQQPGTCRSFPNTQWLGQSDRRHGQPQSLSDQIHPALFVTITSSEYFQGRTGYTKHCKPYSSPQAWKLRAMRSKDLNSLCWKTHKLVEQVCPQLPTILKKKSTLGTQSTSQSAQPNRSELWQISFQPYGNHVQRSEFHCGYKTQSISNRPGHFLSAD